MDTFDGPFLIVHGRADMVTDHNLSKEFYEKAKSKDKTIKLYDGKLISSEMPILSR